MDHEEFEGPDSTPLGEARQWLRDRVEEGAPCPCCKQFAKLYKRKIYSAMARMLITLYRLQCRSTERWHHVSDIGLKAGCLYIGGDFAKLIYWGLIEQRPKEEDDGDKRTSGYWRITADGIDFVLCKTTAMEYVRIYNGEQFDMYGREVDIEHCLGKKFKYSELMAAEPLEGVDDEIQKDD